MICDLFEAIVVEEGLSTRGLGHIAHDQVLLRCLHHYRGVCKKPSRINRVDSDAFLIEHIVEIAPGSILDWDSVGRKKTRRAAGEPKNNSFDRAVGSKRRLPDAACGIRLDTRAHAEGTWESLCAPHPAAACDPK